MFSSAAALVAGGRRHAGAFRAPQPPPAGVGGRETLSTPAVLCHERHRLQAQCSAGCPCCARIRRPGYAARESGGQPPAVAVSHRERRRAPRPGNRSRCSAPPMQVPNPSSEDPKQPRSEPQGPIWQYTQPWPCPVSMRPATEQSEETKGPWSPEEVGHTRRGPVQRVAGCPPAHGAGSGWRRAHARLITLSCCPERLKGAERARIMRRAHSRVSTQRRAPHHPPARHAPHRAPPPPPAAPPPPPSHPPSNAA